jgi:hypothetical protein
VKQFRGQPLEVTVSPLDYENAKPAIMACLPESSERWHMAVKHVVFKAHQSELYKKYSTGRTSFERILCSCQSSLLDEFCYVRS